MKKHTLLHQFQSFIKKTPSVTKYDKRFESDQQMLKRIGIKFAVLFFIILMFDTLVDLLLGLIDFALHIVHLIIEAIEYSLLMLLGQLFNFDDKLSETIIVNTAIIIALFLAYRLIFAAPGWAIRVRNYLLATWPQHIKQESFRWRAKSLIHKIKWLGAYGFGTTCLLRLV